MVKDLIEMLKEQNGDGKGKSHDDMANEQMSRMKGQASSYTKGFGKMPNMGSFKMPKF
jgi:hypothetical protein